jgi:hypothetical protein
VSSAVSTSLSSSMISGGACIWMPPDGDDSPGG